VDRDQAAREQPDGGLKMPSRIVAASLLAALAPACVASNVLSVSDRAVSSELDPGEWHAATAEDLTGLWRTVGIEGEAATVVLDVTYWIAADGTFSGAALFAGPPPSYQVLSGTWRFEDGVLVLGDGEPARVEAGERGLRLTGEQGRLVLERAEIR